MTMLERLAGRYEEIPDSDFAHGQRAERVVRTMVLAIAEELEAEFWPRDVNDRSYDTAYTVLHWLRREASLPPRTTEAG